MKEIMTFRKFPLLGIIVGIVLLCSGLSAAEDEAGSVIALRGRAAIDRSGKILDAKVRDHVLLQDIVSTFEASRVKLLFRDDSVLTLGEKSRVAVKEYVQGKEKGNKAIFNLIDGKMRSVVGKSGLEVRTPTAVAAARGTVILFETGLVNGRKFTIILAYEGEVGLQSIDPKIPGSAVLAPGMMLTVVEGEPFGTPVQASPEVIRRMLQDTDLSGHEISVPEPGLFDIGGLGVFIDIPQLPGISQPAANTTTPVRVIVTFP
jgi:hypothetical protein